MLKLAHNVPRVCVGRIINDNLALNIMCDGTMKVINENSSINDIVDSLGVNRTGTRDSGGVFWELNGIKIPRPPFKACWKVVKEKFGIDCELLKCNDYYQ